MLNRVASTGTFFRRYGLWLACVLVFWLNLGGYALFDVDEPRYAEAAREMLMSGNWVTPYFNEVVRFDKPVLFYWLVAGVYKLWGVSEFTARFWSAVSATAITALLAFWFKQITRRSENRLENPITHWQLPAWLWLTCPMAMGLARMSVTDMTLCALMAFTQWALFQVCMRSNRWWVLAGVFSGLAVLCKGPVGLVLPGFIYVVFALWCGRLKQTLWSPWSVLGVAVCLAVSVPWYWAAYQENGQVFLDALLFHNVQRFQGVVSGHDQPWWFFTVVLLVGFLPWSCYCRGVVAHTSQVLKQWWQNRKQPVEAVDAAMIYGALWALGVFVFFSAAQTRLLTYILPMFPGLALWAGASMARRNVVPQRMVLAMVALATVAFTVIVPWVNGSILQHDVMAFLKEHQRSGKPQQALLATYEIKRPSLVFYSRGKVHELPGNNRKALEQAWALAPTGVLDVVTKPRFQAPLAALLDARREHVQVLQRGKRYVLLRLTRTK